MSEISTINVGNTEYTLKDTIARSQGGGGGSYVLQCFESATIDATYSYDTISRSFSSNDGGCLYLYVNSLSTNSSMSLIIDAVNISDSAVFRHSINNKNYAGLYCIPFKSTVSVSFTPSGSSDGCLSYVLYKYVKLS